MSLLDLAPTRLKNKTILTETDNNIVSGTHIRDRLIASTTPLNGQVLAYNSLVDEWEPANQSAVGTNVALLLISRSSYAISQASWHTLEYVAYDANTYGAFTNGQCSYNTTIPNPATTLDIRLYDQANAIVLGIGTTNSSGFSSFAVLPPGAGAEIVLQVRRTSGSNFIILNYVSLKLTL